ncbi:MAG: hypothetical protein GY822_30425 [Deltaproteobacteria bacterium]|nr:hypothetical protein [Deltaproteobacteria bacterium]
MSLAGPKQAKLSKKQKKEIKEAVEKVGESKGRAAITESILGLATTAAGITAAVAATPAVVGTAAMIVILGGAVELALKLYRASKAYTSVSRRKKAFEPVRTKLKNQKTALKKTLDSKRLGIGRDNLLRTSTCEGR